MDEVEDEVEEVSELTMDFSPSIEISVQVATHHQALTMVTVATVS